MKKDFLEYIQTTFHFSPDEMLAFEVAISKPLKKSIRINTNKISVQDFQKIAEAKGWALTKTGYGKNLFYIDRTHDLSIPLGNTLEHTNGYFYIQEVAASSSPYYLSDDTVHDDAFLILDMSASPGGKTTSLSEYYPQSIIVANELDKKRLKTLFENTDRMGSENVVITNYDGRFFRNFENTFDRILLDAPCSGEGTAFKTDEALKYRNIKNIKNIAKLQFGLLESALVSLKVGGELVYSTCTLNTIENEGVIEKIFGLYGSSLEIVPVSKEDIFKRNWPHKTHTGGFFVAKLRKTANIISDKNFRNDGLTQNLKRLGGKIEKHICEFLENTFGYNAAEKRFWIYGDSVYMTNKSMQAIDDLFFFYKVGVQIGEMHSGIFEPNFFFGTLLGLKKNISKIEEESFHKLMQGYEILSDLNDGYYALLVNDVPAGIGKIKAGKLKGLIPAKFVRS